MLIHLKFILMATLLAVTFYSASGYAQEIQSSEPRVWADISGEDCETITAALDHALIDAGHTMINTGIDKSIIIIARLGRGETSRQLNRRRLRPLVSFMVETRRFSERRIVSAEGERIRGAGRIEIYVGGELHTIFQIRRNRDLTTGCGPAG